MNCILIYCEKLILISDFMNILVIGTTPYANNRGVSAIASSTIKSLKSRFKDVKIVIWHTYPETYKREQATTYETDAEIIMDRDTRDYLYKLPVRVIKYGIYTLFKKFSLKIDFLINDEVLKAYENADIIIISNFGDAFNDLYGNILFTSICSQQFLAILSNSSIVLFPQSIGLFHSKVTQFIARYILNRTNIIMAREKFTETHLIEIGVYENLIQNVPDMAFLLEAANENIINDILEREGIKRELINQKNVIGLSVRTDMATLSNQSEKKEDYVELMVQLTKYMAKEMDSIVIIVPNATLTEGYDNKSLGNEIRDKTNNKDVFSINGEYTAEELKGIINKCDIFIGAMMHTVIAAISMNIPSISLSYSYKDHGVMQSLGLGNYVVDFMNTNYEELIDKITCLWNNKDEIKKNLSPKIIKQKKLVNISIDLLKSIT